MNQESNLPVTVLSSDDEGRIALAESILNGAGIPCAVPNRRLLVPGPAAGGPLMVQVRPEDAETARQLLRDLE